MNSPWQYDETVQVGTDYRDPAQARAYDERMGRLRDVQKEAGEIRAALAVSADSTVWEIGTGTGECALALAVAAQHVYASDVSPAMLDYARQKARQRNIVNVTFADGGFLSGFRPPHPVNGIVTQLALHHLPDFWKSRALAAIASCLQPAGRLYLRDVVFPSATADYDAFFRTTIEAVRASAGAEIAEQIVRHIKTEFSTLDWILEEMFARAGLKLIEKHTEGFLSAYVCGK